MNVDPLGGKEGRPFTSVPLYRISGRARTTLEGKHRIPLPLQIKKRTSA